MKFRQELYLASRQNLRIDYFRFSLISCINAQASQESIDIISIDPKQEFQTHNDQYPNSPLEQ